MDFKGLWRTAALGATLLGGMAFAANNPSAGSNTRRAQTNVSNKGQLAGAGGGTQLTNSNGTPNAATPPSSIVVPPRGSGVGGSGTMQVVGQESTRDNRTTSVGTQGVSQEAKVLWELHHGNQMEITMGKLALQKASAKPVRDFAEKMVKEHGKLDKEALAYAKAHKLSVTNALGNLAAKHDLEQETATMDKLQNSDNARFDRQYMATMVRDHQKDIHKVTLARQQATDPALQKLLDSSLTVMKDHLSLAQKIEQQQPMRSARRGPNRSR